MHFFLSGVAVIVQRHGPLQYVRINYKAVKSYVWHWHCIQQKKLVKKDWCNTGKPSETKQHHQKRAARHTSPSQKCVSPSQDTETTAKGAETQHNTKHRSGQLTIIYQNWVTLTAAIAGDTRKNLLTKSTLSASMATVRVRSAPLQLEMIKKAKGSAPAGGHTGTSFRFPAARPGLCQTASVLACRLTL